MKLFFLLGLIISSFILSGCMPEEKVNNATAKSTRGRIVNGPETFSNDLSCELNLLGGVATMFPSETRSLQVVCADATGIEYSWKKNGAPISAQSDTLSISNLPDGTYNYEVSATAGQVTQVLSKSITVSSSLSPSGCSIGLNPDSLTMSPGTSKTLSISCSVGQNLSYAWRRNGTLLSGNANALTVSGLSAGSYTFQARASNAAGSQDASVTITVTGAVGAPDNCVIGLAPISNVMLTTESKTLTITCSEGAAATSYSWKRGTTTLGNNTNSLVISGLSAGSYTYSATATNSEGSKTVTTNIAVTSTAVAPTGCTMGASSLSMLTTETRTLTVNCTGGSSVSYAWKKDNVPLAPTVNSITLTGLSAGTYAYKVTVSNGAGSMDVTKTVLVTVPAPSGCLSQLNPQSNTMTTALSDTRLMQVHCSVGSNLSYAWKKNGVSFVNATNSFSISGLTAGTYDYSVTISNASGSAVVSKTITVTAPVVAPANCYISATNTNVMLTTETKTLTANCSQGSNFSYAWYKKNGSGTFDAIAGTAASLQISNLTAGSHEYKARITNSAGAQETSYIVTVSGTNTSVDQILALSYGQTCAKLSGKYQCWGKNFAGMYGGTPNVGSLYATDYLNLTASSVKAFTLSESHQCLLMSDNTVKCVGYNFYGQLGNNSSTSSSTPVSPSGLSNIKKVEVLGSSSCALGNDGVLKCWGNNSWGELGLPSSNTTVRIPTQVLTGIQDFALYSNRGCAITLAGALKCWGKQYGGELGNGQSSSTEFTPVTITGLGAVKQVVMGSSGGCALENAGTIKCWGYGTRGQLGNGTFSNSTTPVAVSTITNAAEIYAGNANYCALLSDKTVRCWGLNNYGQLGNGTVNDIATPTGPSGLTNVSKLAMGRSHTCALLADETVKCVGASTYGQIGNGITVDHYATFQNVTGLSQVIQIKSGFETTCVAQRNGAIKCWGSNKFGVLGDGTTINRNIPITPMGAPASTIIANNMKVMVEDLEIKTASYTMSNNDGFIKFRSMVTPALCTYNVYSNNILMLSQNSSYKTPENIFEWSIWFSSYSYGRQYRLSISCKNSSNVVISSAQLDIIPKGYNSALYNSISGALALNVLFTAINGTSNIVTDFSADNNGTYTYANLSYTNYKPRPTGAAECFVTYRYSWPNSQPIMDFNSVQIFSSGFDTFSSDYVYQNSTYIAVCADKNGTFIKKTINVNKQ